MIFGKNSQKVSRIEFACFSFHVGLLLYQLFVFQTRHQKYRQFWRPSKRANFNKVLFF